MVYFECSDRCMCACTCVYVYIYIIFANSENINYVFGIGNTKVIKMLFITFLLSIICHSFGFLLQYVILAPGL